MRTKLPPITSICLILGIAIVSILLASRGLETPQPPKPLTLLPRESVRSLKVIKAGLDRQFLAPKKYDAVQADFDLKAFITRVGYREDSEAANIFDLEIQLSEQGKEKFKREVSFQKHPNEAVILFVNDVCVGKISTAYNADIPIYWGDLVFLARGIEELKGVFPPDVARTIHP